MQPATLCQPAPSREAARDDLSGVRIATRSDDFAPVVDPFSAATLAAERAARPGADLAEVWQALMDRRLIVCGDGRTPRGRYVVARSTDDPSISSGPLSRIETAVLVRVLSGEQQKLVAAELGIACSTASKWYTQGLAKMRLAGTPIPIPLVVAAQTWAAGHNPPVDARSATFEHDGSRHLFLGVPRPVVTAQAALTPAECEVARFLVDGESRWEIAARRATSAQTVACQIRGIFSKWRLTGRYALIRRAVELGWFR